MSAPKKQYTVDDILSSLASGVGVDGRAISVAKHYVQSLEPCVGSECIVKALANLDPTRWQKELAESANRLTYLNSDLSEDGERVDGIVAKSLNDGTSIGHGAILEYDAVLTTRSKDRVGDVLETKGLEIDPNHPVLWQHLAIQPVGAFVKGVFHDETKFIGRYRIADTELGRDTAVLVKCGALRKSIGFRPSEMAPIEVRKGADGKDVVHGWHITKSLGIESSVVSIPCNSDAVVLAVYEKDYGGIATAYSRGELKHDVVKHWAKSIFDKRPTQVAVTVSLSETDKRDLVQKAVDAMQVKVGEVAAKAETAPPAGHACTCKKGLSEAAATAETEATAPTTEQATEPVTEPTNTEIKTHNIPDLITKLMGVESELEGSFEWIRDRLNESAKGYLMASGKLSQTADCYCSVGATFVGSALVSVYHYGSGGKYQHFTAGYEMKDGKPVWTGEPAEVDVKTQVINKRLDAEIDSRTPAGLARQLGAAVVGLQVGSSAAVGVRKSVNAIASLMDADERIAAIDRVGI